MMGMDLSSLGRINNVAIALYHVLRADDTNWRDLNDDQKAEWIAYANRKLFDMQAAADAPA